MPEKKRPEEKPGDTLKRLQHSLAGGAHLLLENLDDEELAAMQRLLLAGEAEIVSFACRPYLSAKLDRTII